MKDNRKKNDKVFKQEDAELTYPKGNTKEIADELDIDKGLLYQWRKEFNENSFSGDETPGITDLKRENALLRKKIKAAKIKQGTLKKAINKFLLGENISSS